nr:hypothetical protein [Streptomyces boncukensis]
MARDDGDERTAGEAPGGGVSGTEAPGGGPDRPPGPGASGDTSGVPLPSFLLSVGDCYDRADEGEGEDEGASEGRVETRDCGEAHDAEVVSRKTIEGSFDTDAQVAEEAESLCRTALRAKARRQPSGTVGGTLISYPKARGVNAGIDRVTCSLTAGKGKKLHKPLL